MAHKPGHPREFRDPFAEFDGDAVKIRPQPEVEVVEEVPLPKITQPETRRKPAPSRPAFAVPEVRLPDLPDDLISEPFQEERFIDETTRPLTKETREEIVEDPATSFDEVLEETNLPPLNLRVYMKLANNTADIVPTVVENMQDIGRGIGAGVLATVLRAQEGMNNSFAWLYGNNLVGKSGNIPDALLETDRVAVQQRSIKDAMDARQQLDELISNPEAGAIERGTRDVTRFLIPYALFRKGVGGGQVRKNLVAGPMADLAAFSTNEDRLSTLVADANIPGLSAAVGEYLATDPDDTTSQAVFKQFMEGTILGVGVEATLFTLSKVWAGARALRSRKTGEATGKVETTDAIPGERLNASVLEEADAKAATLAEEILRNKLRMRPDEDPIKVATRLYEESLQDAGIWDAFSRTDQDKKLTWFASRAKDTFAEGGSLKPPAAPATQRAGDKWESQWEDNIGKVEAIKRKQATGTSKKVVEGFEKSVVDRSGPFRRMLAKTPPGQRAAELFALARGASTKAALVNKEAVRAIYQEKVPGLPVWKAVSGEKRALVDKAIAIRRFRQIKTYKPDWAEKGNPLTRESVEFYDGRLNAMRKEIGEAEYQDVMKRSDHFFSTMRAQLDELLDGGVISKDEYQALSRFQFSPVKYVKELDKPIAQVIGATGKPISVSSSGIKPLGKGAQLAMETDTEIFLQEVIIRSTTKAMKNKANLALRSAAKSDALPGVQIKIPKGEGSKDWTKVTVMQDGKPKNFFISREYSEMWAASPETMDSMWRTLGWVSGAPLVRAGATGPLNPEFALSNFPRDMMYNILTSNQFSAFLPRALKQWGEDFGDVWQDAIFQRGSFNDYINEGGGMDFLSHQGIPGNHTPAHSVIKDWEDAFSYTNTTSEVINRLITRNRALKNIVKENGPDYILTQADREHATFIARNVIDFDQGGTAAKALNEIVPYLNAAVQGMRGYARSFKVNPTKASAYAAQLMGVYASVDAASRIINNEAHQAIPDYIGSTYMTVTTPWSFTDEEGDKRFLYFKFPIDHSTTGLKILSDSLMRAGSNQGLPNEKETTAIKDFGSFMSAQFGIVPGATMPPTISAAMSLAGNFDWWRQSPVWMGEQGIPARMEFTEETPPFFRDVANAAEGIVDLSPARMESAARQVIPENIFTNMMGAGYKEATSGIERDLLEPMEKEMIEKIKEFPGARRFLGFTSPNGRFADEIREIGAEARGQQVQVSRQVDAFTDRISAGVEGVTMESAATWIQQEVPFERREIALKRLVRGVELEKIFKRLKYDEQQTHLPSRRWWRQVAVAPATARAKLLVEHVSAMQNIDGDKQRKEAKKVLGAVMSTIPGFLPDAKTNPEYAIALKRELELHKISPREFFE